MQHSQNNTNNRDARREENRWKEYNRLRYSKVFFLSWSPYKSIDFNLAIDTVKYLFFLLLLFFSIGQHTTVQCYAILTSLLFSPLLQLCGLKPINFDSSVDAFALCASVCLNVYPFENALNWPALEIALENPSAKLLFMFVFRAINMREMNIKKIKFHEINRRGAVCLSFNWILRNDKKQKTDAFVIG